MVIAVAEMYPKFLNEKPEGGTATMRAKMLTEGEGCAVAGLWRVKLMTSGEFEEIPDPVDRTWPVTTPAPCIHEAVEAVPRTSSSRLEFAPDKGKPVPATTGSPGASGIATQIRDLTGSHLVLWSAFQSNH